MAPNPSRLQLVIYLTNINFASRLQIALEVQRQSNGKLAADPLLLPIDQNAPPEIPRIVIQDQASRWNFELAGSRIDLSVDYGPRRAEQRFDELASIMVDTLTNIWASLGATFSAQGNRLAMVTTTMRDVTGAVSTLQSNYLQPNIGDKATEGHLYLLTKQRLGVHRINEWVRLVATSSSASSIGTSRFICEIDLNTEAESPISVTTEAIQGFFSSARQHTSNLTGRYLVGG